MRILSNVVRRSRLFSALCAIVAIVSLNAYLRWPKELSHNILLMIAAAVLTISGVLLFEEREKRLRRYVLITGICFAAAQICGARLNSVGTLALAGQRGWDLTLLGAAIAGLSPAVGGMFVLFVKALCKTQERSLSNAKARTMRQHTVLWGSAAVILICWFPVFLAYYPGLFTYDISWQYEQFLTREYSTHHPLLHTLMVGGFSQLGKLVFGYPVKGVAMYTLFQMTLLALSMAYALSVLYKHGAPRIFCIVLLAANALLPFNSLLAISSTKDTLFAASVLYLCVLLMQSVRTPDVLKRPSWIIRFLLAEAAVGMMRNNGFVCIIGILIVGMVAMIRHQAMGKRFTALCLGGLVLFAAGNAALKAAVNAEEGAISEALSVPIQQLSRVYMHTEGGAKAEILQWLPNVDRYSWSISDPVKGSSAVTLPRLPDFLKLWAHVGLRHPVIYADAFIFLSGEYFCLNSVYPKEGFYLGGGSYLDTSFHDDRARMLLPRSLWPWLRDTMKRLYSQNEFRGIPLYSSLLSPGLWCWIMLISLMVALYLRSRAALLPCISCFALFLSMLLGPCAMFRYTYPLIVCAPFLLGLVLLAQSQRFASETKEEGQPHKTDYSAPGKITTRLFPKRSCR